VQRPGASAVMNFDTDSAPRSLREVPPPIQQNHFSDPFSRAPQTNEIGHLCKTEPSVRKWPTGKPGPTLRERTRELKETGKPMNSAMNWLMRPTRQLQPVVSQIKQVAACPLSVLIQGETGTGKELVARAIHQLSGRCSRPFVPVDSGALPDSLMESELFGYEKGAFTGADQRREGRFQLAKDGTLFLDEIANLAVPTQAKMLRVLQDRQVQPLGGSHALPVGARIISATNVTLLREIEVGHFRLDLYHRLNEFEIVLPPLRERDDILDLANEFLAEAVVEFGSTVNEISEGAADILLSHSWPGNVRELRNVMRRAAVLGSEVIEPDILSFVTGPKNSTIAHRSQPASAGRSLKEIAETAAVDAEQAAIHNALHAAGGNMSKASRDLQTNYKTLYLKMKHYGISASSYKGRSPSDLPDGLTVAPERPRT
jgi:DNA-binding NtrC family response regulator